MRIYVYLVVPQQEESTAGSETDADLEGSATEFGVGGQEAFVR